MVGGAVVGGAVVGGAVVGGAVGVWVGSVVGSVGSSVGSSVGDSLGEGSAVSLGSAEGDWVETRFVGGSKGSFSLPSIAAFMKSSQASAG